MRKFFCTCLFLVGMTSLLVTAPTDVHANETARQVEELSAQGAAEFGEGEFAKAIELFEQAYELEPVPNLLYNIGRCYEQLEQWDDAIASFESFITSPDVDSDAREHAMERVQSLREIKAAEAGEDPDEIDDEEAIAELDDDVDDADGPNLLPGYAALGASAVLLAGGITMGVLANGNATQMADNSLAYDDRLDAQSSARTQGIVADVFYVSSAAAAAAGIYLILTAGDGDADADESPMVRTILPWANSKGAGVGLRFDF